MRLSLSHTLSLAGVLTCALAFSGCFLFHQNGSDGGASDGGSSEDTDGGDGSSCPWFGTTRLCRPLCPDLCPGFGGGCSTAYHVCYYRDERGQEGCSGDENGFTEFCMGERVCMQNGEASLCVDTELCRWARTRSEPEYVTAVCRYSDGTLFVDGPPERECGEGARESMPFCGGPCGDSCRAGSSPVLPPSCVGMSETRAFGVCSPNPNPHCEERNVRMLLGECGIEQGVIEMSSGDHRCACMRLSTAPGAALPDWGHPVSEQSCLAYRAIYPDQVSCLGVDWTEL